ncbi:Smr/MutS family protein [Mycoplasma crocodyli]|uniref:Smr/MutS family protein n=1 Tax=Mycoplasma crocodyli TaxID=50052 RepID=UPI00030C118B|nr:Smr/MutS family protein [Mycoplasma crocodyli]
MKRTVDLHGLYTQEASILIIQNLNDLINYQLDVVTFITGKGTGALKSEIEHILSSYDVEWNLTNADGAYVVKRNSSIDIYEDDDEIAMQSEIDDLFKNEMLGNKF